MEEITILMQEYKELLITKGKYEELKGQQGTKINDNTLIKSIPPYRDVSKDWTEITCNTGI